MSSGSGRKGKMLIVSQNKEKVLWFGRAFNALEYSEQVNHKGKKETVSTAAQATRPAMYKKNIVYEFPAE